MDACLRVGLAIEQLCAYDERLFKEELLIFNYIKFFNDLITLYVLISHIGYCPCLP